MRSFFESLRILIAAALFVLSSDLIAFTANSVRSERFLNFIRVSVTYTVPELKELRTAYIDLTSEEKASQVYWELIEGADFYLASPDLIRFVNPAPRPEPWSRSTD